MKYTIVSWNCNGGFRNKFRALFEKYPGADIYVIEECEDPYFYEDEEFKRLFNNGFRIGIRSKGLAVFARPDITLRRLKWPEVGDMSFAPVIIDEEWTLIPTWTHGKYVGELHDFLDLNAAKFDEKTVMIGDFNSSVFFDKSNPKCSHSMFIERMAQVGLMPMYHHLTGEEQGKEATPTFYTQRKKEQPFHIDHVFGSPKYVLECDVAPNLLHDYWLTLSDHVPVCIEVDTDPQPKFTVTRIVTPASQAPKPKEEKRKPVIQIRMPNGKLIVDERYGEAFRQFVLAIGWERVYDMNFDVWGQDLITQEKKNGYHKELVPGWYINLNMRATTAKTLVHQIAKALGEKVVCTWGE